MLFTFLQNLRGYILLPSTGWELLNPNYESHFTDVQPLPPKLEMEELHFSNLPTPTPTSSPSPFPTPRLTFGTRDVHQVLPKVEGQRRVTWKQGKQCVTDCETPRGACRLCVAPGVAPGPSLSGCRLPSVARRCPHISHSDPRSCFAGPRTSSSLLYHTEQFSPRVQTPKFLNVLCWKTCLLLRFLKTWKRLWVLPLLSFCCSFFFFPRPFPPLISISKSKPTANYCNVNYDSPLKKTKIATICCFK